MPIVPDSPSLLPLVDLLLMPLSSLYQWTRVSFTWSNLDYAGGIATGTVYVVTTEQAPFPFGFNLKAGGTVRDQKTKYEYLLRMWPVYV